MSDGVADTDNGYTRIAHDLLEALAASDFSKREFKLILTLIRKTYGYNKKEDDLTFMQLSNLTGIKRSHVSETVRGLVEKNVFLKRDGHHGYRLKLNKNYGEWGCPKSGQSLKLNRGVPKRDSWVSQNGTDKCPKTGQLGVPKRDTTIDNYTKDNSNRGPAEESAGASPSIWDVWVGVAGEKNRSLLAKMIRDHGEDVVASAVGEVAAKRPAEPVSYLRGVLKGKSRSVWQDAI